MNALGLYIHAYIRRIFDILLALTLQVRRAKGKCIEKKKNRAIFANNYAKSSEMVFLEKGHKRNFIFMVYSEFILMIEKNWPSKVIIQ